MNERMSDLLDLASDDAGAPLGFGGDTIVRRARVRRRRRHGGIAAGLAAAGVAGVLALSQVVGSARTGSGPSVGPSTSAPPSTASSSAPVLDPQERAIVDRCARARAPGGISGDTSISRIGPNDHSGRPPRAPRAGFLHRWMLDAHVQDARGATATFVNPEHTRWVSCQLVAGGTDNADEVTGRGPLPSGPVPRSWYGPDGFRHQATSPDWSQVCAPGDGKVCPRELFAGAFARYAGVAAVRVDAPDGTVLHPVLGTYTYVFRHVEERVDAHRASNDMQALPSMPVTLLDAAGRTIIRYDYFPSYLVPSTCPATGGC
ncbi:MAG TPA: hypothetical protein VGK78_14430 [Nocardioides sp.]|uniref:hypothetical protein n=1 Tax=Nocardioides sp. TaxID=35761 RepID=UPI002F420766